MATNREDTRAQARERLNARMERRRESGEAPSASARSAQQSNVRQRSQQHMNNAQPNRQRQPSGQQPQGNRFSLFTIGLAAFVVVLIVVLVFAVSTCASSGSQQSSGASQTASSSASASSSEQTGSSSASMEPKQDELVDIIGEERAAKLIEEARIDDDALWIASNPEVLAFDGPEVQAKILKLAADDPLSLPFVRAFADEYPHEGPTNDESLAMSTASPSSDVPDTNVPHLYQWDRRWGYTVYNADAFGLSGCGPTSLAMAYQCVTGKDDLTPYDMGQLAYEGGYVVEWLGTANGYFTDMAGRLGMTCEEIDTSVESIKATLASGKPIVANVGKGYFSTYGHYFVLAGLTDDGQIIINDPYSATRSSQAWDPDLVSSEAVALYAYSA